MTMCQTRDTHTHTHRYYDPVSDTWRHPQAIEEATRTLENSVYTSLRHVDVTSEKKRFDAIQAHLLGCVKSLRVVCVCVCVCVCVLCVCACVCAHRGGRGGAPAVCWQCAVCVCVMGMLHWCDVYLVGL
jgi:hypothetical protein